MRKIPVKNYIILFALVLLTVVSTFYIRSWYITNKEYYSRNSVIKDVVREINIDEIGNYTLESPKFILYVSSGGNLSIKDFENRFKKFVQKNDIIDDVIYLNVDNVDGDLYSLLNDFSLNNKVSSLIVESDVSLYVFNDGNSFSDKQLASFIKKWGFISG